MPISAATAPMLRVSPAAAGMATAPLLRGPELAGVVVASTSNLTAIHVPAADRGAHPGLICLTSHDAVRLPCAMVLATPLPQLAMGTPVSVGNGRLRLPDAVVTAARWRPAPLLPSSDPLTSSARAARCPSPPLDPDLLDVAATLACALRSSALRLEDAVGTLLGLGPGLTPVGDDVLAGALVALRAVRSPVAGQLATAIDTSDPLSRTSTFSAGLLGHAARGLCVPQLAAFLAALGTPGVNVSSARRHLFAVGHTSGAGLYTGVLCALVGPGSLAPNRGRA